MAQFYCALLGFTPDESSSFHVNLGRQQLHLSVGEPQARTRHCASETSRHYRAWRRWHYAAPRSPRHTSIVAV